MLQRGNEEFPLSSLFTQEFTVIKLYHPILDLLQDQEITTLFDKGCITMGQFCNNLERAVLMKQEGDDRIAQGGEQDAFGEPAPRRGGGFFL